MCAPSPTRGAGAANTLTSIPSNSSGLLPVRLPSLAQSPRCNSTSPLYAPVCRVIGVISDRDMHQARAAQEVQSGRRLRERRADQIDSIVGTYTDTYTLVDGERDRRLNA